MKFVGPLTALAGVALLTALVVSFGFASVVEAVASVGFGAVLVIGVRAISLVGAGIGWWLLLRAGADRGIGTFIGLRYVREAINTLVPVAQVGGDLIGARLLTSPKISGSLALASVLIDIFLQVVTLAIFALIGLGILVDATGSDMMTETVWGGIAVAIIAVLGFFLVLNFGAFEPLIRRFTVFAEKRNWNVVRHLVGLGESLQAIWRNPTALAAALVLHFFVWCFGAAEIWIALQFMGHPVSIAQALAIESLAQAGRAAGFAIPGGLGVQDGALIAVGAAFGIPVEVALAVALVKRLPDLGIGVPSLLAWQAWKADGCFAVAPNPKVPDTAGVVRPPLRRTGSCAKTTGWRRDAISFARAIPATVAAMYRNVNVLAEAHSFLTPAGGFLYTVRAGAMPGAM